MSRARWNELLDEALYTIAPRGAWDPSHPAWRPARDALADALRRETAAHFGDDAGGMLRDIVTEHMAALDADERRRALEFYRSPGGMVFVERRITFLALQSYGLPWVVEPASRDEMERRSDAAKERLLHLPDDQTGAVYDFTNSPLGERLQQVELKLVAEQAGNVLGSTLDAVMLEHADTIARRVRSRVHTIPPPSTKTHLGTVAMRADRTLDVRIEVHEHYRILGTYAFTYAPDSVHWRDVAAGVQGIAPGQTRPLYRDAAGHLSDVP
jgi:hypothetical protein